jgi:ubiquinone/menaquinone biosynthesis C-methylase UbiE
MIFGELLSEINGGKVLDVGCGSGQFIEILIQSLGSFESVTGVDVDESVLREAGIKYQQDAFRFMKASSQSLPFEEGSFDLVTISKALHHVENDRQTLGEMKRVLKQGGYLFALSSSPVGDRSAAWCKP